MNVLEQLVSSSGNLHGLDCRHRQEARRWSGASAWRSPRPSRRRPRSYRRACSRRSSSSLPCSTSRTLLSWMNPSAASIPVNATLLQDTLVDLRKEGRAILFSTHRMDQVEKLCDEIALISERPSAARRIHARRSSRAIPATACRSRIRRPRQLPEASPPSPKRRITTGR